MSNREFRVADEYQHDQSGAERWILSHLWRHKWFLFSFVGGMLLAQYANTSLRVMIPTSRSFLTTGTRRILFVRISL